MKNVLSLFSRRHRPDIEALSAYVDGRLDPAAAAALEAHIGGCSVCATELADLRSIRTMLSSMGSAAAPRSFRVRQADLEGAGRATGATAPQRPAGVLAFAPALSALAVVLLVGVVWLDTGTRGDSGADEPVSAERATVPGTEAALTENAQDSAGGVAADEADGDEAEGDAATAQSGAAAPSEDSSTSDEASPSDAASRGQDESFDASTAPPGAIEEQPAASPASDDAGALTSDFHDEDADDGLRPGFLALEIGLIAVALGAAGAFVYARWRRRKVA